MSQWHYEKDGKPIGPISEDELTEAIASRQLHRETLVWRAGMAKWVVAGATELSDRIISGSNVSAPPPPIGPTASTRPAPTPGAAADATGWRALFRFSGRIGRFTYLAHTCIAWGIPIILAMVIPALRLGEAGLAVLGLALMAFLGPALWIGLACAVKRAHDLGHHGAWVLVQLIPYAGWIYSLFLLFAPGSPYSNKYGEPLSRK